MRLTHISDHEIQAYLDRARHRGDCSSAGSKIQEHLDGCLTCREELEEYRLLHEEMVCCLEPSLPRNFAKKVTLSLPPFAAAVRSRNQKRLTFLSIVATLASLVWLFLIVDFRPLLTKLVTLLAPMYAESKIWLSAVITMLPAPSINLPDWSIDWTAMQEMIAFLAAQKTSVVFLVFAACAILLVSSLDNLILGRVHQRDK